MRHISEVLRLSAQGHSQREMSTSVRNYLARATRAGLSWPLHEHLDAAAIEARLFKRTDEGVRSDRPEPDWLELHREHKRGKHVTLQLLHFEYKQAHPNGWGYTQFCRHYKQWLGRQDVVMRLEYPAGERMFVDLAGDTVPVIDLANGINPANILNRVNGADGNSVIDNNIPSPNLRNVRIINTTGGTDTNGNLLYYVIDDMLMPNSLAKSWSLYRHRIERSRHRKK